MSVSRGAVPAVRFRILGQVAAEGLTGPLPIGGATAQAVLAVLLLRGDAGACVDEIVAMVWGGHSGASRDSVYHYVSTIRKALATTGFVLQTRQPRYRLAVNVEAVDWLVSGVRWRMHGRPGTEGRTIVLWTCSARRWICGGGHPGEQLEAAHRRALGSASVAVAGPTSADSPASVTGLPRLD